ncbi:PadR family transcriptional regulator [Streptomyces filamentosus]|uniref:PadR family transcriptional regulator n=1 Tax=Streptomyces filamentosus TaxID=67294 RepID=UPI0033DD016F
MTPGEAAAKHARAAVQLRKGVLEYCVLALMRDRSRYGVELVHALEESGALATSQGTVYPLLSRLRRDDLVTTTWQESASGPPRRYYALTDGGRAALDEFARVWPAFRTTVDAFLTPAPASTGDPA